MDILPKEHEAMYCSLLCKMVEVIEYAIEFAKPSYSTVLELFFTIYDFFSEILFAIHDVHCFVLRVADAV